MRSGLLNERLKVLRINYITGDDGYKTEQLVHVHTYWCRVVYGQRQRTDSDNVLDYDADIRFELRYELDIKPEDVIEYRGEKFYIKIVERHKNLDKQTLVCNRRIE